MGRNLSRAETDPAGVLMYHAALQVAGLLLAIIAVFMEFGAWPAVFAVGVAVVIVSAAVEAGEG
jgi:uncharacterized membrane protein